MHINRQASGLILWYFASIKEALQPIYISFEQSQMIIMNDDGIDGKCCVRISKDNIIDSFDKLSYSSSIAKNTCTFRDHMEAICSIDSKSVLLIANQLCFLILIANLFYSKKIFSLNVLLIHHRQIYSNY